MFFDIVARDKASNTFSRIAKSSENTERRLRSFGRATAGALGFVGVTQAATAFIKVGADYAGSLNKIQALSGLTDSQLAKVSKTLEGQSNTFAKMGQTTGDAAGGMVELVKAGLKVSDAMKAVQATMVLAKAGELSVADASSLVANTLNTFHLKAERAGDIANYLANAANISSANVTDLAESFKYVAPIAAATGVSLAQTNAILAELSNSGIDASNAGTGFRKFLLSLQAPAGKAKKDLKALNVEIFDSQGKMKPLGTVIDALAGKLNKLTDQKRQQALKDIFGLQGISSAQVILQHGKKGLDEYTKGVVKAGAAQRLANANSKGFAGTLATLRAETISAAQAGYRQLSPALDDVAKKLVVFVDEMKTGKGAGGDVVEILKDLAQVAKVAAQFVGSIPGPVKKLGVEALIAYLALKKFSGAFGGLGGRIAPSIASMKQFRAELSYTETRSGAVSRAFSGLSGVATQAAGAGGMALLFDSARKTSKGMSELEAAAGGALTGAALGAFAGPEGAAIGAGVGALAGVTTSLWRNTKKAGDTAKAAQPKWQDYASTLNDVTGATTAETKALIFQRLQKDGLLTATRRLGITDRTAIAAVQGNVKARGLLIERLRNSGSVTDAQRKSLLNEIGALDKARKSIREQTAATKDYGNTLNGLPKRLVTEIKQNGIQPTKAAVIDLNNRYNLTPKQVSTLLVAANVRPTKANIQSVIDKAKEFGKQHPKPKIDVDTSSAKRKLADLNAALDRFLGKSSRTSTSLFPGTHPSTTSHTSTSLFPPTTSPKRSTTSPWSTPGTSSGSSATNGLSPREAAKNGATAGSSYMGGIISGIAGKRMSLGAALDKVRARIQSATDKIKNLEAIKSEMKSTFQADSIFGADPETSGSSLGSLMQMQKDQQAKAAQVLADVKRVQSLGLSGSLLKQLQSQGESGAQTLHLLAGADKGTIAQFNASNAATQQSLQAAGLSLGNDIRRADIDKQISVARRQEQKLEDIYRALRHLGSHQEWVVQITAGGLVKIIRKEAKAAGKTPTTYLNGG